MNKTKSPIQFHFKVPCVLKDREPLKAFIVSVFRKEKTHMAGLNIIFCDDDYLLNLNRQFLHHEYYTDILSFPLSGPNDPLTAEIYISIDRVRDNAGNLQTSFREELHRVIFHGILHFCGYKDKSSADIKKMRAMEDKYLIAYFKALGKAKT
jgi:metalloprotein, YbeY/UPF0054 family